MFKVSILEVLSEKLRSRLTLETHYSVENLFDINKRKIEIYNSVKDVGTTKDIFAIDHNETV